MAHALCATRSRAAQECACGQATWKHLVRQMFCFPPLPLQIRPLFSILFFFLKSGDIFQAGREQIHMSMSVDAPVCVLPLMERIMTVIAL